MTAVTLPKKKRVVDRAAIQAARKPYCERCGAPAHKEPHHIVTVGSGGGDVRENLIQLCFECHVAAHAGQVPKSELVAIVVQREEKAFKEICEIIGFFPTEEEPILTFPGERHDLEELAVERLLNLFCSLDERFDDLKWLKGEIADYLLERQLTCAQIAAQGRCSTSQVSQLVKTFRAFPDPGTRVPELTHYHHRLAARTDDPGRWIAAAAEHQWSTRQLREAIQAAESPESKRDLRQGKAEKCLRLAREVLAAGGEPAAFLKRALTNLFKGQITAE